MNIILDLDPPEGWQARVQCNVMITETEYPANHKCDFCDSTDSFSISPVMKEFNPRYHSYVSEDEIKRKVENGLEKVYRQRYVCKDTKCRMKFQNETWAKINHKPGWETHGIISE